MCFLQLVGLLVAFVACLGFIAFAMFNFNEAPRFVPREVIALNTLVSRSVQMFFSKHTGLWKTGVLYTCNLVTFLLMHLSIQSLVNRPKVTRSHQLLDTCEGESSRIGNSSTENMRFLHLFLGGLLTVAAYVCLLYNQFVARFRQALLGESQGLAAFHFRDIYELLGRGVPRNN